MKSCDDSILGPVHTYPDMFESVTFSFQIPLPSKRIQRIRQQCVDGAILPRRRS